MIRIIGNRGEGAGLLTNLAVEKILETYPQCLCFLIDGSSEFRPLVDELQGKDITLPFKYSSEFQSHMEYTEDKTYMKYIESKLKDGIFYRFLLYEKRYEEHEYEIEKIEKFVNKLSEIYSRRVFLIYKSVND